MNLLTLKLLKLGTKKSKEMFELKIGYIKYYETLKYNNRKLQKKKMW